MRVLVTGGLGAVVQGLSRDLRSRGHSVLGCDLAHDADELGFSLRSDVVSPGHATCDVGEFRQRLRLFDAVGPFGLVCHCAVEFDRWNAKTSTNSCYGDWPRNHDRDRAWLSTLLFTPSRNADVHLRNEGTDRHGFTSPATSWSTRWTGSCRSQRTARSHAARSRPGAIRPPDAASVERGGPQGPPQSHVPPWPFLRLATGRTSLPGLRLPDEARVAVVTDSGVQEETTRLGVPCLTLRTTTERPVTIQHGTSELVPLHRRPLARCAGTARALSTRPQAASGALGRSRAECIEAVLVRFLRTRVILHAVFDSGTEPLHRHVALGSVPEMPWRSPRRDMSPDETVCEVDLELVVNLQSDGPCAQPRFHDERDRNRPTSEAVQRPGERGVRQEHGETEHSEEVTRPRLVQTGVDHRWRRDDAHDTASRTRGTSGYRTRGSKSFSDSRRPTLRLALRVERSQALGISLVARPAPPPSAGAKREWDPVSDVPTATVVC